jgi:hypothetical protein
MIVGERDRSPNDLQDRAWLNLIRLLYLPSAEKIFPLLAFCNASWRLSAFGEHAILALREISIFHWPALCHTFHSQS